MMYFGVMFVLELKCGKSLEIICVEFNKLKKERRRADSAMCLRGNWLLYLDSKRFGSSFAPLQTNLLLTSRSC